MYHTTVFADRVALVVRAELTRRVVLLWLMVSIMYALCAGT